MKHHISPPKGLLCPLAEQELLQVQPLPAVGKDLKFSNYELWMSCVSVRLVKRFFLTKCDTARRNSLAKILQPSHSSIYANRISQM